MLLLVFDGLLHDYLVLARYVVKFEHELLRERVVSLSIAVDTELWLVRIRLQFSFEF